MPRRVDEWVDHHEAVLNEMSVSPPFRLIGWSFGGVVATELARRLRTNGVDVSFVGMIDTIRPMLRPLSSSEFLWYHVGVASAMTDPRARLPYLRRKTAFLANRRFPKTVGALRALLVRAGVLPAPKGQPGNNDLLRTSILVAYLNYDGGPISFPVSIYATERSIEVAGNAGMRWAPVLHGGYELVRIPGGHRSLWFPEHVDHLAHAVRSSLLRAERSAAGEGASTP